MKILLVDDENFGSDRKQGYECARLMKKHGIYWASQGARAASISKEDLEFYKEHNLIDIEAKNSTTKTEYEYECIISLQNTNNKVIRIV